MFGCYVARPLTLLARISRLAIGPTATMDPDQIGHKQVGFCENLLNGRWMRGSKGQVCSVCSLACAYESERAFTDTDAGARVAK